MNPKTKPVKARKFFAPVDTANGAIIFPPSHLHKDQRINSVYVLPADADSYAQMVEQMAWSNFAWPCKVEKFRKVVSTVPESEKKKAVTLLASIGILPPHGEGRK